MEMEKLQMWTTKKLFTKLWSFREEVEELMWIDLFIFKTRTDYGKGAYPLDEDEYGYG